MKKMISFTLSLLISLTALLIPISANSAPTHWTGVDVAGATVTDRNCPIEVTREVLTFDLAEFPKDYYHNRHEYLAYTGRVTAEYTFSNPTDLTVTARLVFPFGNQPDYAGYVYDEKTQSYVTNADTEKYELTLNGQAIEKKIRYTLNTSRQFNLSEDLPKLLDHYVSDPFFSPDMTVTKYTYLIGGIDEDTYHAASVAFDWDGGDGNTKLYFPDQHGFQTQKDGDGRFQTWADNGKAFVVYAIGEPLSSPLSMKCYENGGVRDRDEIDGTVTLTGTKTFTLEELALTHWSEETGVSKIDWYNAVIDSFDEGFDSEYHYVSSNYPFDISAERFTENLLRWYEYEITIPPRESVINRVTAPLYPAINMDYEPDIFTYTYLLSPATMWAEFGELEVIVNTPFYMTETNLEGFEKTESGYRLKRVGLPDGDLTFTLCLEDSPKIPPRTLISNIPMEIIISFSIIGGILLLIGGGIALLLHRRKKRDNKA